MILLFGQRVDLVVILALALILSGVLYAMGMLVLSRFEPRKTTRIRSSNTPFKVIFMIPCLNEEAVVKKSVEDLLKLKGFSLDVLVIDDGSDDNTAAIVRGFEDSRVHLFQRFHPVARQGKGEALNAAYAHILAGGVHEDLDPATTIICVVDADGRLEAQTLQEVIPQFDLESLGAVQIGVRINNRNTNLLARMQDLEFVLYTDVFQRGRRHLHSVGLGGNGQFVRLSALKSLGGKPWTRSLAEDLDLGVRLHLRGWDIDFCSRAAVHQQGLVDMGRWVRQRTRWFQGHLQAWPLVPWVLRDLKGSKRVDLVYHITSPYLLLVGSILTVAFGLWIVGLVAALASGLLEPSWWWLTAYIVAFGPATVFAFVYWKYEKDQGISRLGTFFLLHVYVLYSTLWYFAGWKATYRIMAGKTGWSKTERILESATEVVPAGEPKS